MIEIRPHLFLGTQRDARNERELKAIGVTHLLCVTTSFRYPKDESIVYLHQPIADEGTSALKDILEESFSFIDKAKDSCGKVLLFCRQAQNRSPSVAIAYLMQSEKISLREAYSELLTLRQEMSPHESYFSQLQEFERNLFGEISFTEQDRGGSVQQLIREMWEKSK